MLSDFVIRALLAGVGIAALTGPLGCFVVWRRMAYFGDTLAHGALLGIALSLLMGTSHTYLGVMIVSILIALIFAQFHRGQSRLSDDSVLGILSHISLALGLVVLAMMRNKPIDLMAYLFGDILAVSQNDLILIYGGGLIVLSLVYFLWRDFLFMTVNKELAHVAGIKTEWVQCIFVLLFAIVIAIAIKLIGVLLITSLMILPAAVARNFAKSPEQMAILSSLVGMSSVLGGLMASLHYDLPTGPAIVLSAGALFMGSLALRKRAV